LIGINYLLPIVQNNGNFSNFIADSLAAGSFDIYNSVFHFCPFADYTQTPFKTKLKQIRREVKNFCCNIAGFRGGLWPKNYAPATRCTAAPVGNPNRYSTSGRRSPA
jgi:hypothetical protein